MNIVLHEGKTFVLAEENGSIVCGGEQGLFHDDTRFLSKFKLNLDGMPPLFLSARSNHSTESFHFLSNPAMPHAARGTLTVVRRRLVGDGFHEDIDVGNYGDVQASFDLGLEFKNDFSHIFTVKQAIELGAEIFRPDTVSFEKLEDGHLIRIWVHQDGLIRETHIRFSELPDLSNDQAVFHLTLPPRGSWHTCIDVFVQEAAESPSPRFTCENPTDALREETRKRRKSQLVKLAPEIETDHPNLASAVQQAVTDIIALRLKNEDDTMNEEYSVAAGIPWFMALFGRDSLIASYQTLLYDPSLARGTLRALAKLQGKSVDLISCEEPGKILHEYRRGMTSSARKLIPKFPYYGSIDSTPLWVITLSEYLRWTGDMALVSELSSNLDAAISWMENYGDRDGDGLLEYALENRIGLTNQGWKDSNDSTRFRDGRIANSPIALVEVQGYAFDAFIRASEIYSLLGNEGESKRLKTKAKKLREIILNRFWIEGRSYFAEALDGEKKQVDSLTSNPGHLLWSKALPKEIARKVADVLLSPDLFSGYGVRTMACTEGGYNPISYHNGSVWPHENSLIVSGLSHYGLSTHAARIIEGLLHALSQYSDGRLPELFSGFPSNSFPCPVEYPTANRPQAWASGAVILLLRSILGIDLDLIRQKIDIRPLAVPKMHFLRVRGIVAGENRLDIEVKVKNGKASATFKGLPASWHSAA